MLLDNKIIKYEISDIIKRFLLVGDKFMPEMHLWNPKVKKYSACSRFTRHQQRSNEFMKDGKLSHIAKNRLDAACFQHDSAYSTDPKVNEYQRSLAAMVYKFFDERTKRSSIENKQLAEQLHKPIITNFKRRKVYSSFKDNIWGC